MDQETDKNQQQTIARITDTQREEQQEERTENRRRVELIVIRPTVHTRKRLKEPNEPVIVQFDRRCVLRFRVFRLIIQRSRKIIESLVQSGGILYRAEAFKDA